jgi:hypothetical protein
VECRGVGVPDDRRLIINLILSFTPHPQNTFFFTYFV